MTNRRIRRNRVTWLWLVLVLLIVALIWLFLTPEWYGENISQAPPGTEVRKLEPQPVPPPEPGSFRKYDQPGEAGRFRPEQ